MTDTLDDYLPDALTMIDDVMVAKGVPLKDRPFPAAVEFVEHFVLEVSNGSKDDPIGQRWFDALLYDVLKWYRLKYRNAFDVNPEGEGVGLVVFRSVPLSLKIPLTVSRPSDKPGYNWLHFPTAVRDDENPLDFLRNALDTASFSRAEVEGLIESIRHVVALTRGIKNELMTANLPDEAKPLAGRIMPAIGHGVRGAGANDTDHRSASIWDFNLAAELCLKAFLHQRGVRPKNIHDITALYGAASQAGLQAMPAVDWNVIPSGSKAIQHRYGECDPPTLAEVEGLYRAILALVRGVSSQLSRKIVANNAAFLVRTIGTLSRESVAAQGEGNEPPAT